MTWSSPRSLAQTRSSTYKKEKFEELLHDFDAVLDTIGGETYVRSFKVLKKGGRIASLLEQPRQDLMQQYGVEAFIHFTQVSTESLVQLAKLVDEGAVRINVEKTFPLGQAAALVQLKSSRHAANWF